MLTLFRSLDRIARWKAQTAVEKRHAADLIDLHVRDCEAQLRAAKSALAALLVRQRAGEEHLDRLTRDEADLTARTKAALAAGQARLAKDGADAIADLENQIEASRKTAAAAAEQTAKTRRLVEGANRRLLTLRQAAVAAKAQAANQQAARAVQGGARSDAFEAAEALIARLNEGPDPQEHAEAMAQIDAALGPDHARDELAKAGFGAPTRHSGASVLARLKAETDTVIAGENAA